MEEDAKLSYSKMELINKIIFNLYDAKLPIHNRIINFFHAFTEIINFDRASVLFFYQDENGVYNKKSSISVNWNGVAIKKYDTYYCHIDDTLPVLDQPFPIIFRSNTYFNNKLREKTEYWKDYMLPNNSIYEVAANLQLKNNKNLKGSYAFYRGDNNSDFTDDEMRIIKMFQPHLSAILQFYGVKMEPASILSSLESYSCVGLCILNENFQIIHKTGVFEQMNKQSGNTILQNIIRLCISHNKEMDGHESVAYEYKLEDEPIFLEVNVMPQTLNNKSKSYFCMAYDLAHFFSSTLEQIRTTHNLSVREFEVFIRVLRGQKNEDIAQELYLSVPTIKRHLTSIYSKLDITNQKQIFNKLKIL